MDKLMKADYLAFYERLGLPPLPQKANLKRIQRRLRRHLRLNPLPKDLTEKEHAILRELGLVKKRTRNKGRTRRAMEEVLERREKITREELVQEVAKIAGCKPYTVQNMISLAKRVVDNPFPFHLVETRDRKGHKVLTKVKGATS